MGIPIGTTFTTKLRGQSVKTVLCEGCGAKYVYVLERVAKGSGFSLLFLDNSGAQARASAAAEKALKEKLAKSCDPVSCPECGEYQRPMVRVLKWRSVRWWLLAGAIGLFVASVAKSADQDGLSPIAWKVAMGISGLLFAWVIHRYLALDPNAAAAKRLAAGQVGEERALRMVDFEAMVRARAAEEQLAASRENPGE
jgi:hypothetical protein